MRTISCFGKENGQRFLNVTYTYSQVATHSWESIFENKIQVRRSTVQGQDVHISIVCIYTNLGTRLMSINNTSQFPDLESLKWNAGFSNRGSIYEFKIWKGWCNEIINVITKEKSDSSLFFTASSSTWNVETIS